VERYASEIRSESRDDVWPNNGSVSFRRLAAQPKNARAYLRNESREPDLAALEPEDDRVAPAAGSLALVVARARPAPDELCRENAQLRRDDVVA